MGIEDEVTTQNVETEGSVVVKTIGEEEEVET